MRVVVNVAGIDTIVPVHTATHDPFGSPQYTIHWGGHPLTLSPPQAFLIPEETP